MPRRVLVCDDEAHVLRAVTLKLSGAGFEVLTASDGQQALELMEGTTPDLLITDCEMPRMNGFELCERVRGNPALAGLPILMLTAKAYEFDEEEAHRRWGVSALLTKPFSPRVLAQLVEATLAGGGGQGDHRVQGTLSAAASTI